MTSKISILVPVLVSLFGLTSCSPDTTEDPWRLKAPHISDPSAPDSKIALSSSTLEVPSSASELVFAEDDLARARLDVTANCSNGDVRATEGFSFRAIHKLSLASLWPLELWKKLPAQELEKTVCAFHFRAVTDTGSTHTFKISGLRLRGFATFDAEKARRAPEEKWTLLCEGFTSETTEETSSERQTVHALARRASVDTRPLGHQECRLLTNRFDERSGAREIRLSHSFQLSFPNPLGTSRVTKNFDAIGTPDVTTSLISVKITNPASYPIAYRVAAPSRISLQPVMRMLPWSQITSDRAFVTTKKFDESLAVSIEGAHDRWTRDGFETFVIAPGETASVNVTVANPLRCVKGEPDGHWPPYELMLPPRQERLRAELVGFHFGFTENFRLESIDYWTASKPREPSESYTPVNLTLPSARPFVHEGFQGTKEFVAKFDPAGHAPRNFYLDESLETKWCFAR